MAVYLIQTKEVDKVNFFDFVYIRNEPLSKQKENGFCYSQSFLFTYFFTGAFSKTPIILLYRFPVFSNSSRKTSATKKGDFTFPTTTISPG